MTELEKYELTDKKNDLGLYQIRALKDFADVKEGDLGGWVASEQNLSQIGNCWVYGNAWVSDNARVKQNVINLIGLKYNITIYENYMQIGCELHTIKDWYSYSDKKILSMEGRRGLKFWHKYKEMLKILCEERK